MADCWRIDVLTSLERGTSEGWMVEGSTGIGCLLTVFESEAVYWWLCEWGFNHVNDNCCVLCLALALRCHDLLYMTCTRHDRAGKRKEGRKGEIWGGWDRWRDWVGRWGGDGGLGQ